MSIQSEIDRISGNVQDTISTIQQTGVSVPSGANSNNLPSLAAALANTKQDKLTGTSGQFVGFDSGGNATAVAAPTAASIGAVPTSRTVNGKALSANISLTAADVGADAAGAASGVQTNLTSHINNTSNPHGVTAAQAGALPTAGGTMTGAIAMGENKITGLAAPTENADAARKQDVDDFEPQSSAVQLSAAAQAALGLGSGSTLDDAMELLSGSRFFIGSRVGTGKNNNFTINFPEKPKCVFFLGAQSAGANIGSLTTIGFIAGMDIMGTNAFYFYFIGYSATDWRYDSVRWRVSGTNTALDIGSPDGNAGNYLNDTGDTYYYIYIV